MSHLSDHLGRVVCWICLWVTFALLDSTQAYTARFCHHGHPSKGLHVSGRHHLGARNHSGSMTRLRMSADDGDDENEPTFYEILGASPNASRGELKKKYIQLARVSHPDAQIGTDNSGDEVDFQSVAEAWRTLGNPKSRRRYDRYLKAKKWGEAAQKLTNERLEQVAPMASSFMDNLAVPFLRKTSATVGKAFEVVKSVTAEEASTDIPSTSANETAIEEPIPTNGATKPPTDQEEQETTIEVEAPPKPIEATGNENEPNGATPTDPITEESKKKESVGAATIDTFDDDTPEALLDEKSELEEEVKTQEEKAKNLSEQYNSVKEKRLFASLQSPECSLTSSEAEEVLEKLNAEDTVSFQKKGSTKQSSGIQKDILSLRNTEEQFTEKLESYTKIDLEWNKWLTKQESAKKTLRENKQKEFEARRALDTATEDVTRANTDVIAVSNKLRGVEQEVRKSAQEMDKVSTTLSRKQEKVQRALKRKTELMKGGISVEYATTEEVKLLRKKESQLLGESKQIATMVAKLQSRADQLKKRAEALEKLKNK